MSALIFGLNGLGPPERAHEHHRLGDHAAAAAQRGGKNLATLPWIEADDTPSPSAAAAARGGRRRW